MRKATQYSVLKHQLYHLDVDYRKKLAIPEKPSQSTRKGYGGHEDMGIAKNKTAKRPNECSDEQDTHVHAYLNARRLTPV
jgi:hypothetical protein